MNKLYLDAGTTWSKILEIGKENSSIETEYEEYLVSEENDCKYYVVPSLIAKKNHFNYKKVTGHMSLNGTIKCENEIIALSKGALKIIKDCNFLVLDLGSRDVKWTKFKERKFVDLDWNTSCASATGATVEMLLKFYNLQCTELEFTKEKYNITCGIFGLEKIMDDIANGESAKTAIAKFIHGIAFNAWSFAKQPEKIYLSGGFCDNKCFVESLKNYCEVIKLGRFVLCEGLVE